MNQKVEQVEGGIDEKKSVESSVEETPQEKIDRLESQKNDLVRRCNALDLRLVLLEEKIRTLKKQSDVEPGLIDKLEEEEEQLSEISREKNDEIDELEYEIDEIKEQIERKERKERKKALKKDPDPKDFERAAALGEALKNTFKR